MSTAIATHKNVCRLTLEVRMDTNQDGNGGNGGNEKVPEGGFLNEAAAVADAQRRAEADVARRAAEAERERLAKETIAMLRTFLHTALTTELGVRIENTPYGDLWNIGTWGDAVVLAAEDGRAFNVRVSYDNYIGQSRWQQIARMRAEAAGHEPGPWEYAGTLGYISTCEKCGGMMAVDSDKRPHGEQFSRPCSVAVWQQRMDLDYDPTSENE